MSVSRKNYRVQARTQLVRAAFEYATAEHITLMNLSDETGIAQVMLSGYRSDNHDPSVSKLEAILAALGAKVTIEFPNGVTTTCQFSQRNPSALAESSRRSQSARCTTA